MSVDLLEAMKYAVQIGKTVVEAAQEIAKVQRNEEIMRQVAAEMKRLKESHP
jgi:hypothetical protein